MAAKETNHYAIPQPQLCANRLMSLLSHCIECVATALLWRASNQTLDGWTDCYLRRPLQMMNSRA